MFHILMSSMILRRMLRYNFDQRDLFLRYISASYIALSDAKRSGVSDANIRNVWLASELLGGFDYFTLKQTL